MVKNTMEMNRFVQMFKDNISEGKSIDQSFVSVASHLAWMGAIEDLQQLEEAYWNEFMKELGEVFNEQLTRTV